MSESGYRQSTNEIKKQADASLEISKVRREKEREKSLNLRQIAGRIAATAMITAASGAFTAAKAYEAGENSVKKDIGMEYAGEIDKNIELSLFPDERINVEEGDGTQRIYHRLGFDQKGYTVAAFEAEIQKRNPEVVKPNGEFDIRPGANALIVPKLPE